MRAKNAENIEKLADIEFIEPGPAAFYSGFMADPSTLGII